MLCMPLLALERDSDGVVAQRHASRGLFGTDGPILCLVLNESNALATRHGTHFLEARKAREDCCECVDAVVFGHLSDEQNLVGGQVFVGHNSCSRTRCSFEARSACCLWCALSGCVGLGRSWCRSFEVLGRFGCFESLLAFCPCPSAPHVVPIRVGTNSPFSALRWRLCCSSSSAVPSLCTVASLLVRAKSSDMDWPNSSNPLTSSMAFSADCTLSKTIKACPLRFKLDFATMSTMVPYSSKISRNASISCGILMRSDKFLAWTLLLSVSAAPARAVFLSTGGFDTYVDTASG